MSATISFKCPVCGSEKFVHPTEGEIESNLPLTCSGCGEKFTRTELEQQALDTAEKFAKEALINLRN